MTDQELILSTLDEYAEAYCAKNLSRLMAIFVDGDDISLIGTGSDELCSDRSGVASVFARNFQEATATKFEWGWTNVAVHDRAATVAIALIIHINVNGEALLVPVRWTVSLVRTDQGWKWVHRHASVAAVSQEEGSAYPIFNR